MVPSYIKNVISLLTFINFIQLIPQKKYGITIQREEGGRIGPLYPMAGGCDGSNQTNAILR
jgi:hypothetical protein